MKSQDILPVLISILVIILVAVLKEHSKFIAAITATMPLGAPLALWIVYASANGECQAVTQFNLSMLLGILPTIGFLIGVYLAAHTGWKLGPMLVVGYAVWGFGFAILLFVKRWLGLH